MTDLPLRAKAPSHCCPYCLKPVGYLGNFFASIVGTGLHRCDFLNVVTEAEQIRQRVEGAENDVNRLHQEKVMLLHKFTAAETALRRIIARSHNGELGSSKVLDMRRIAEDALEGKSVDIEENNDKNV